MPFSSLADEIILQISKLIGSPHIDNFAFVNKTTYRVCYDRLKRRKRVRDNAKVMATRFNYKYERRPSPWYAHNDNYVTHPWMKELDEARNHPKTGALAHLEFMELNGDLRWLEPLDDECKSQVSIWYQGKAASKEELANLKATTERLGLHLPEGFLLMMGSNELISRMYMGGDYFSLGSLVKCNPIDDQNGDGYVIRFLNDQQDCGFWNLYMSHGGHHCIVRSVENVECSNCSEIEPGGGPYGTGHSIEGHEKYELHGGIPIACKSLKLQFEHPNFEAWLAFMYFNFLRLCWYSEDDV